VHVPSSWTPGGVDGPHPLFSGLPPWPSAKSESVGSPIVEVFRGSITRPVHSPSYASLRGSPHAAQGLGFPGVGSSRGRTRSIRWCLLLLLTYFLLPVCAGAPLLSTPTWISLPA
jgi:hypothetical protein